MNFLIVGLAIWVLVHFIPSLAPSLKKNLQSKLGETGYKIFFTISIVVSLGLIIYGWRGTLPSHLFSFSFATKTVTMGLMLLSIILFGAAKYPTRIKNIIRHPQLTGVAVWSVAHLISNGDTRSVVLFGTLGIWAVLEMLFISRREGAWTKIAVPGWSGESKGFLISIAVYVVLVFAHPYLSGVALR